MVRGPRGRRAGSRPPALVFGRGAAVGLPALLAALLLVLALVFPAPAPARGPKNFVWSVSDASGVKLYVLGSVHLAREDLYPLNPAIEEAFAGSRRLVVEVNMREADEVSLALSMMARGTYQAGGETLFDHLDAAAAGLLRAALAKSRLPEALVAGMRPWLAALTLEVEILTSMGYAGDQGLDSYFVGKAMGAGMPIGELETAEEQMAVFSEFGPDDGVGLLTATLMEIDSLESDMAKIFEAWRTGDAGAFEEIYFQVYREHPDLSDVLDRLIIRRNDTMTSRLAPYLQGDGPVFVVVGASHLVGPRGILAQLRALGLTVEQL